MPSRWYKCTVMDDGNAGIMQGRTVAAEEGSSYLSDAAPAVAADRSRGRMEEKKVLEEEEGS